MVKKYSTEFQYNQKILKRSIHTTAVHYSKVSAFRIPSSISFFFFWWWFFFFGCWFWFLYHLFFSFHHLFYLNISFCSQWKTLQDTIFFYCRDWCMWEPILEQKTIFNWIMGKINNLWFISSLMNMGLRTLLVTLTGLLSLNKKKINNSQKIRWTNLESSSQVEKL